MKGSNACTLLAYYLAVTACQVMFDHLIFGDKHPAIRVLHLNFIIAANLFGFPFHRRFNTFSLGIAMRLRKQVFAFFFDTAPVDASW